MDLATGSRWALTPVDRQLSASAARRAIPAWGTTDREPHWVRCNKIYGSPLCISIIGNLDERADINVWYSKNSGPERSVRLYLERCESPKTRALVAQAKVKPGGIIDGSKTRYIYRNSCWIGVMRVLNQRWVTVELVTKRK